LGQDNFADYYVTRRRTGEEPRWTHSLELRLLAHTGFFGFALFGIFVVAALAAALSSRRRAAGLGRAVAGVALLPFAVWLIHGSVDWFWEIPALSGPALGFLGMAAAVGRRSDVAALASARRLGRGRAISQPVAVGAGALALLVGVVVLGFPYLSVREVSAGSDAQSRSPTAALGDFKLAAELNPLSAVPDRFAGALALQTGDFTTAQARFQRSLAREPGAWFSWLGAGLAASALGYPSTARSDYRVALSINSHQPAVRAAAARVLTAHPLTTSEAFGMLLVAN